MGAAIPSLLISACLLLMLLSQPLSASPLYHEEECSALLGFKSSFFSESHCDFRYGFVSNRKMMRWKAAEEGTAGDCCNWGGVTCDEGDGHVIGLDLSGSCLMGIIDSEASIFHLVHLQDLNLAYNWFNQSRVPSAIGRLPRLTRLNLSSSGFSGEVVPTTMRLLNILSLDLSYNRGMNVSSLEVLLQSLNRIEELDLSLVMVSDGKVPRSLGNMTSLRSLFLASCGLTGEFPDSVSALPRLEFLDLSDNHGLRLTGFHRGSPIKSLKLSWMSLTGEVWIFLRNLTHLTDIDLSSCEFGGEIPSSVGDLGKLETLNLENNGFHGPIPSSLGNLTNLRTLDLSGNGLSGGIPSSLGNLIRLNELVLGFNQLAGDIPTFLGNLINLTVLDLSVNRLSGEIPSWLGNLIRLNHLDLSANQFTNEIPSSLGNLTSLKKLELCSTGLSGEIPSSLGNLIQLNELVLCYSHLAGEIPSSLGNLTNLTKLDLSGNRLHGEIPSSLGNLIRLEELHLFFNQLSGEIPSSLMQLSQLSDVDLSFNILKCGFPPWVGNFTSLTYLSLSNNELFGPLPHSIYQLQELSDLYLSSNYLTGVARLDLLLELKGIMDVRLSFNAFSSIIFPEPNASVTQVEVLYLDSSDLTEVPRFLQQQNELDHLSLSKNNISGYIPQWLLEKTLGLLDLSFNNIQGTLPMPLNTISNYLISNNRLSGEIPSFMCEVQNMNMLDLSDNNFTGVLPPCFGNFSSHLDALSLRGNNFAGKIPEFNHEGCMLSLVDLSSNSFEGTFPRSIANCHKLEYVNLGNNKFIDTFPSELGSLPMLRVIMLHSNMFHGVLKACGNGFCFPSLKVITLSNNNLRGRLTADYFKNWPAMKYPTPNDEDPPFTLTDDNLLKMAIIDKGVERKFEKTSRSFALLDFSQNNFIGTIPESIGDNLLKLHTLNLSNNHFSGPIPLSLAKLKRLEALDLSRNKLSGEIPAMLMQVTSLEIFNVSYNNLSGPIPGGNQFSTFQNTSYIGNPELCGSPLTKKCGNPLQPSPSPADDQEQKSSLSSRMVWITTMVGLAGGLIVGVALEQAFGTDVLDWLAWKWLKYRRSTA